MMLGTWELMIQQPNYELNLRFPPELRQVLAGKSEWSNSTHWETAAAAMWSSSSFSSCFLLLPDVLHPSSATIPQVVPSVDTFLGWWSCACPLTDAVLSRLSAGICIWTKWSRPAYCCFFSLLSLFFPFETESKECFCWSPLAAELGIWVWGGGLMSVYVVSLAVLLLPGFSLPLPLSILAAVLCSGQSSVFSC